MDIQDLGSIGELVAAVATVATLIYLAIQVRHNTESDKFATMDRITADVSEFSLQLLKDEEMQAVFTRYIYEGVDFDQLGPDDKLRVRMVLQTVFIMVWRAFEAKENDRLSDNSWHIMIALLRNSYFPSLTVETWFNAYAHLYPEDFVVFIAKEIQDAKVHRDA